MYDKKAIRSGKNLEDGHINFAQALAKHQFPSINGLQSTLTITKCSYRYLQSECSSFLQVVNVCGNHWVVASNYW